MTYDVKKLDSFILEVSWQQTINPTQLHALSSKLKLNIGNMCVWGGRDQEEAHSCISHDTITRVVKYIIVSFRIDHRSSKSIVPPAILGNKLEIELSAPPLVP